eukprot:12470197-Alexandrium_andersonii.AAC.1
MPSGGAPAPRRGRQGARAPPALPQPRHGLPPGRGSGAPARLRHFRVRPQRSRTLAGRAPEPRLRCHRAQ